MVGRSGSFPALTLLHPASLLQAQAPNCSSALPDTKIMESWVSPRLRNDSLLAPPQSSSSNTVQTFACFDSTRIELCKQGLLSDVRNSLARAKYLESDKPVRPTETIARRMVYLNPRSGLGEILASFLRPKPSIADQCHAAGIDRHTAESLEAAFEYGGFVTRLGSRHFLVHSKSGADTAMIFFQDDTRRQDAVFYKMWHDAFGFESISAKAFERGERALRETVEGLGLELASRFHAGDMKGTCDQYSLIMELLNLLPETVLKNCMLDGICLFSDNVGGKLSAYRDKWVYMYRGIMNSSKRNVAGLFLHELGHATGKRYLLGSEGDPSIPLAIRQAMRRAHMMIANAMIGLDYAGGPDYRERYQRSSFDEFIAELHLLYVAAGPKLRQHIEELPEPDVQAAWRFIYQEIKGRIFNGYEFDYRVPATMTSDMPRERQLQKAKYSSGTQLWLSQYRFQETTQQHTFTIELAALGDQADPLFIGRHVLPFEGISREHALIVRLNNLFFLQDLGSKNGTAVWRNGRRLFRWHDPNRSKSPFFPLLPGDEIRMGHVHIHIRLTTREHPFEN